MDRWVQHCDGVVGTLAYKAELHPAVVDLRSLAALHKTKRRNRLRKEHVLVRNACVADQVLRIELLVVQQKTYQVWVNAHRACRVQLDVLHSAVQTDLHKVDRTLRVLHIQVHAHCSREEKEGREEVKCVKNSRSCMVNF